MSSKSIIPFRSRFSNITGGSDHTSLLELFRDRKETARVRRECFNISFTKSVS